MSRETEASQGKLSHQRIALFLGWTKHYGLWKVHWNSSEIKVFLQQFLKNAWFLQPSGLHYMVETDRNPLESPHALNLDKPMWCAFYTLLRSTVSGVAWWISLSMPLSELRHNNGPNVNDSAPSQCHCYRLQRSKVVIASQQERTREPMHRLLMRILSRQELIRRWDSERTC